jgi:hypothetical protein
MIVFLHTSRKNVSLGIRDEDPLLKQFCLDSRLVFQNPSLFFSRFIKALNKVYSPTAAEKDNNISDIVFSISGRIDQETGIVLRCKTLDNISYPLNWDGFNFKKSFQYLPENRIHILSSSTALALGIKAHYKAIQLPALVVSIGEEIALSLIYEDKSVEDLYWTKEGLPEFGNQTAEDLLTDKGLDDIVFSGILDIYEKYTDNIIQVLNSFLKTKKDLMIDIKTIAFFSDKLDFIYTDRLIKAFEEIDVIIPDKSISAMIPLMGCLEYFEKTSKKTGQITHIEYWVKDKKVHDFTNYEQFVEHFRGSKPIANPENEYRIYYLTGRTKRLKMKYLSFEEELKAYRF